MQIPTRREGRYAEIYQNEPFEPFSSEKTEERANITAWFLVERAHFTIAIDHGIRVEKNNGRFEYRDEWILMLPKDAMKYRNDIEKMQNAVSDFWLGWSAYKQLND